MKSPFKKFLITFLTFGALFHAGAQNTPSAGIVARAKNAGDSVVLRWAFTDELAWKLAHETGYIIERRDISVRNAPYQRIAGPLKPWSAEAIRDLYLANQERYTGITLATLYGNTALKESEFTFGGAAEMARLLRMRYAYNQLAADLNAKAAEMSALRFVDRNISAGKTYAYRIYAPIDRKACITDTAIIYVVADERDSLPKIPNLNIRQGDRKLELIWDYLRPDFAAFDIERSADGGRQWKKLNAVPFVVIEGNSNNDFIVNGRMVDTGLTNYQLYRYRISAYTTFGESVPSQGFAQSYPKDLTPPDAPEIDKITRGEGNEMQLSWTFSGNRNELQGYRIGRADRPDGVFIEISVILPPNSRSFTDPNPDADFGNYYMVYAMDTAGNVSASIPKLGFVKDERPPATPEIISALMDTTGKVTIIWKPSAARDLMGYKLYTANDPEHEFGLVTGDIITDSIYYDSLDVWSLSKFRYYRIAALDLSYNMSPLSAIIPVRRPDLIPPVSPAIVAVRSEKNGLHLRVQSSTSEDVQRQYIELLSETTRVVIPFTAKPGDFVVLFDTLTEPGVAYEARAFAVDSSGNQSIPSQVSYAQRPVSHAGIIRHFHAQYVPDSGMVLLNWALANPVKQVAVYRAEKGAIPDWITQVDGNAADFRDTDLQKGKTMVYCIKLLDDQFSVFSRFVEVRIPE
jgi:uncharacterized protein